MQPRPRSRPAPRSGHSNGSSCVPVTWPSPCPTSRAARAELRAAELQGVTAALAEVLSPEQVADVIVTRALAAMGASAGGIVIVDPDGRTARTIRAAGYAQEIVEAYESFPLDAPLPA